MAKPGFKRHEPARILVGRGKRETLAKILVGGMSGPGTVPSSNLSGGEWSGPIASGTDAGETSKGTPLTRHQAVVGKGAIVAGRDDQVIENGDVKQPAAVFQLAGQGFVGF